MNKALHRIVVTSSCLLLAAAATSCFAPADGGGNPVPVAENGPTEIDDAAIRAMQTALAHPDEHVLEGLPQIDAAELLGSEKIRNGIPITFDNIVGNGVVFIGASVAAGDVMCSAQVINKWFLLTAAHCIQLVLPSGTGDLVVAFTNRAGARVSVYSKTAYGFTQPDWRLIDRDTGLIFLPFGLTTCQGTVSECASSSPNVPANATFQYFNPSITLATVGNYAIAGYGATDDMATGVGFLRVGGMAVQARGFTTDTQSFRFLMNWTQEAQTRSCKGDSGSPLVSSVSGRLIYTGIASSLVPADSGCTATSGSVAYSGLSQYQASWVLSGILQFRDALRLPFDCAAASALNLTVWACDNDGKLY